jgi:hypothetical protein
MTETVILLSDDPTRWLPIVLSLVAALAVLLFTLWRLGGRRRATVRLRCDESANATIEFALVLPVLLFLCLTLVQTTFLMGAPPFVHYASFAAARSAVVQIPVDVQGGANYYIHEKGYRKHDAIKHAAEVALLPICANVRVGQAGDGTSSGRRRGSGSGSSGSPPEFPLNRAIRGMYQGYGMEAPPWLNQLRGRSEYATWATEVTVGREIAVGGTEVEYEVVDEGVFGAKDAIAVRVDHRYALTVPWANRIYAEGSEGTVSNNGFRSIVIGGSDYDGVLYWRLLSAQARLTNAGVSEELPPRPELERLP